MIGITGATRCGKGTLSSHLGLRLDAEIIVIKKIKKILTNNIFFFKC